MFVPSRYSQNRERDERKKVRERERDGSATCKCEDQKWGELRLLCDSE